MDTNLEIEIINSFVVHNKCDRYKEFVQSKKNRNKFIQQLYHFKDFDPRKTINLRDIGIKSQQELVKELHNRGGKEDCYIISTLKEIDGKIYSLEKSISYTMDSFEGIIISCVPGKLAYFEDEDEKLILEN